MDWYSRKVLSWEVSASMDGKGRAMDNIFIERLWRSVKYEEIYLNDYATTEALRKALRVYFNFYNTERPHQTFDAATPLEVYRQSIEDMEEQTKKLEHQGTCGRFRLSRTSSSRGV